MTTTDSLPADQGMPLLLIFTLASVNFMQALDQTIANVSLPAITGDLGAVPSQGAWIVTSYAIANAISVPLTGWLANRYGQVRVFTQATMLFTLSSLLCSMAWSLPSLIAFRLLQGAAGGLMLPLSQSLLLTNSPPEKRNMALGIWVSTTMMSPLFGPILGGWITDNLHWSWIFLINLPVGVLASASVWQLLKDRDSPRRILPLDRVGLVLLVLWVGALQLMLDKGNELDWFESDVILLLGIVALLGFALFLAWESGEAHPIVDLSLFQRRNFLVAVVTLALVFGTFRGMILILPLWLQTQVGYTAQWAGFVLAPSGILALILVPIVSRTVGLVDPRLYATVAIFIYAICAFWRAHFVDSADFFSFAAPQFLQGAAVAFFFAPLMWDPLESTCRHASLSIL